jgi:hypothetical protein
MSQFEHLSDIAQLQAAANFAQEKIQELIAVANEWQLNTRVSVENFNGDYFVRLIVKKGNGAGMFKDITADECFYYKDNLSTLADVIANDICESLFKQQIKNQILDDLTKSVTNVVAHQSTHL